MAKVITKDKTQKYNINSYSFKVLSDDDITDESYTASQSQYQQDAQPQQSSVPAQQNSAPSQPQSSGIDTSEISQSSKDALIESLMKKTDEMSSNFIKLQMKLEDKENEYKEELAKVKEQSFNEGVNAGVEQAKKEHESVAGDSIKRFSESVTTLEKSSEEFKSALESIKGSLLSAAVDIAKEVISVELSENSSKIAEVLSNELIDELKSASKITLKVNPKDHGEISKNVGKLENVDILSDDAVSKGGVIALSDAGNIDAEISKRFERVKKAALSE